MARKHPRRQAGHRHQAAQARHQGRRLARGQSALPHNRKAAASGPHRSNTKAVRRQKRLHHIRHGTHFGPPRQRRKQRFGLKHHRRTTRFHRRFRVTRRIRARGQRRRR